MVDLPHLIFIIFSLLSCAPSHLSCASPATFTRRHLTQAPVTSGLPFFPAYGPPSPPPSPSLPPPPAPTDLTFPANISALVLPTSPKPHTASRTLLIPVISAVLAVSAAIILALFLYGRWRGQNRHFKDEPKTLPSETNPSEPQASPIPRNTTENNKLSVSASGSSFVKPDSPEISPLPPLPALSFLHKEDDEDDDFYSPQASLANKEQRNNPYSNFSPSPSSTSDFPAMISPVRNDKRVFTLWNQNIGFPRVSSASTSPERGMMIKTPDAYARSSMYSSVSTTPERFLFRKVLETSPQPRWNDLSRNVKSLFISEPARDVCINISESASVVHPPPRRPPPPTPEPPSLAPPPSQSFMVQKSGKKLSFSELQERPKTKLKPLAFRPSSCRKNTWDGVKFDSSNVNPKQRSLSCDLPMLNQESRVLDPRKCQSVAFLLTKVNLSTKDLLRSLQDGHYEALGVELLESLSRIALSEEEEMKLKSYNDEEDSVINLAPSERFLKDLLSVPFVFKRIDALLSVATFGSKIEHLKRSFGVIQAACEELRNTNTLLELLEAGLGRGTKSLEALLELVGSTTVLYSVVHNIKESEGIEGLQAVRSLSSVLVDVKKAAEMDYGVLRSEVFDIYQGVKKVSEVLLLLNGENGHDEEKECLTFRGSMTRFLETAVEEIKKIETIEGSVIPAVKEITKYYYGDSAKEEAQVLRVFVVVREFLSILDEVCKEMDQTKEESTLA